MTDVQIGIVKSTLPPDDNGDDGFTLHNMECHSDLGRPFKIEATLLTKDDIDSKMESLLGKGMSLRIALHNQEGHRYFHGLVAQIQYEGSEGDRYRYQAILRPWVWFLKHTSDNRIFQEMTAVEIIKKIFEKHGRSASDSLTRSYEQREYCVQYGETDFDFVSRLMEEEGIYYYFDHSDSGHDLVLVDSVSAHGAFPKYEQILYYPPGEDITGREDHISHWECLYQAESTVVVKNSYNYESPSTPLEGRSEISRSHDLSAGELYEYGRLYDEADQGTASSRTRIEEKQAAYQIVTGGGNVMGAVTGYVFELEQAPIDGQNGKYLVIGSRIQFQNNDLSSGRGGAGASFSCFFKAIPDQTTFRPARITPKGKIRGPQTAVVVGPENDEIYTDSLGRVKVQFHWDREGKTDENSSCMVRVSTAIAGSSWGMVAIPRIGQEVIVDFLEGDPDQPIIVGSVYNEENKVPYSLPDNMTQSGFKSRSTDGKKGSGEPKNFNEIRFEDKKDNEEIFIQAEKDFKRVVKNNDVLQVGLQSSDVKDGVGDQTIEIHNNRTVTLKDGKEGNDKLTIEKGDRTTKIKEGSDDLYAKKKITIEAGDLFEVKVGKAKLTMKKNGEITIEGKDISIKDSGATEIKTAKDINIKSGKKTSIDAKMDVDIKSGMNANVKAQMNTKVEGGLNIELKGGAMAKVEGGANLDLKGAAMAKLKGGITMIG